MKFVKAIFLLCALTLIPQISNAGNCAIINGVKSGDCANNSSGPHIKDLNVTGRMNESGIVGNINVVDGGLLVFSGVAQGNVNVARGGIFVSSGVINGTLLNNGGDVELGGVVQSLHGQGGTTKVTGVVNRLSGPGPYEFATGSTIEGKKIGGDDNLQRSQPRQKKAQPPEQQRSSDKVVILSCESESMRGYGKYQSEFTLHLDKRTAFDTIQNQRYQITRLTDDEILLEGPEQEVSTGELFGGSKKFRPWVRISRYTLSMNWHFEADITVGQCTRVARKRAF